ncbi:MAG TPA: hypothetical protein PLM75_03280, partial [bacterium]|nr:hypothetical protein [bacterium]
MIAFLKKNQKHIVCLSIIIIVLTAIYYKTFDRIKVINGSDITRYFYFSRTYLHNYFQEYKKLPKWEPYTFSGRPFFAMIQNAALYPLTYLSVFFSSALGINLAIYFNLLLAAIFMYAFCFLIFKNNIAALLSAFIYALAGFSTMCVFLGHITIINTLPYLPASFLFLKLMADTRKTKFLFFLAATLALQFFGGQPQFLFYTLFALSLFFLFLLFTNQQKINFSILFISGLLVFFIIILPYYLKVNEFLKLTVRAETMGDYNFYTYWSFDPKKIITMIMPFFYGTSFGGDYWRMLWRPLASFECYNAVLGVVAVFFIFLTFWNLKRAQYVIIFFVFLFCLSFVLALGRYTPLYEFFHYYIPGFKMFRWPVRLMFLFQFCAAILAGYGSLFLALLNKKEEEANLKKIKKIVFIIFLIITCLSIALFSGKNIIYQKLKNKTEQMIIAKSGTNYHSIDFYFDAVKKIQNRINISILQFNILLAVLLFALLFMKEFSIIFLTIVLIVELSIFHSYFIRTIDNNYCVVSADIHSKLDGNYRIISDSELYPPGINLLFNKMSVNGYEPFILKKYAQYANAIELSDKVPENLLFIKPDYSNKLLDLLSVKYAITERDDLSESKYKKIYDITDTLKIYENINAAPIFYISAGLKFSEENDMLVKLQNSDYNYNDYVYISEKKLEFHTSDLKYKIINYEIKDDYAKFQIKTNNKCVLVFNYIYYPGWSVKVNN